LTNLRELKAVPADALLRQRYDKFRAMGVFNTEREEIQRVSD
jgi:acetyl-CoA carboxylase alpha subunit